MPIKDTARISQDATLPPPQGVEKARADRARGGHRSARAQQRDSFGQFAGGPRTASTPGAADVSPAPRLATDAIREGS